MKNCFKCGNPAKIVADREVTCSDENCFVSSRSFSIEEWEFNRPILAMDLLPILKNIRNVCDFSRQFLGVVLSQDQSVVIEGLDLPSFLVMYSGMLTSSITGLDMIIGGFENESKKR